MSDRRVVESEETVLNGISPHDARERKRVLNVLAQRRYRRRKKHKQALLEDMLTKAANVANGDITQVHTTTSHSLGGDILSLEPFPQAADDQASGASVVNHDVFQDSPDSWFMEFLGSDNDALDLWPSSTTSLSTELQVDDVRNTTFPDDYHLAVPELDLLRASVEIASRMHSAERLWDLQAVSIFQDAQYSKMQSILDLPENLQPTKTQLSVTHHPILDLLPWPSVRDKLIRMYSMPPTFWPRHPEDGSECSVIRLVYDMEAGGVRVWGADPASEESWEIEESLFAAWWWALDGKILLATNRRRAVRGQRPLQELSVKRIAHTPC